MDYSNSPILSVNEAARYLRLSRANLYRLFKSGDLSFAKIGGRTLIRREDADALFERSVAKITAPPETGNCDRGQPPGSARDAFPTTGIFA